ncbi:carbohydrate ABC transporter permease [Mahella australiensis]|uniref:Carbohydrate ABC transporter membrane protein 2, CUT1 family n=1 Tax=Mahella australiensis (strain DSM 15567 / CIP 107919 / 50-1 BON) TaxID=697281 RepID=F3ZY17_MAHA5|nr:carbohydrate ABC transporter permease [Mahella australiensis]AEE97713.1 carbohydrate ABC transporter membrane protein 2, CUT1 family [Mahella australiensis 50-1 BON]
MAAEAVSISSNLKYTSKKRQKLISNIIVYIVLTALGFLFLFPFLWMVTTSIKADAEIFTWPPTLIPHSFNWRNYPEALTFIPFFTYLKNTLIYCFMTVIGVVFSCTLSAYGFSRINWPERDKVFMLVLATMMLPSQVTMIPLFVIFKRLGWTGTLLPLIVPSFFGSAFYIFLLRQFFMTIPFELSDAARIDGCSEFRIFWQITVPLARPAIATVALFQFLGAWNDFMGPLIYLNDQTKYTISVGLQQFVGQYGTKWGLLTAASTVATLPVIILFFFTQKTFIQGIAMTGIKG